MNPPERPDPWVRFFLIWIWAFAFLVLVLVTAWAFGVVWLMW